MYGLILIKMSVILMMMMVLCQSSSTQINNLEEQLIE